MEEYRIGDNKRSQRKKVMALIFVFVAILVVGTSYALWQLTFTQTGTNVITTGCLNLTLIDDTDAINLTDATPIGDEEGKKLVPYNFTLENTCNTETSYIINLETVSQGDKILADNYVKANLIKGTDEVFIDKLIESHENQDKVIEEASVAYMLNQGKLAGKEKVQFSLRLWMDEDTPALDEVMSATWQGKITITASYVPKVEENDKELYNIVKNRASLDNVASEFVTSSTGIDFGVAPSDTNGKGVYTIASTKDNEYPVHYFRGAVTNNNVKFANFCWKIVRTTETGGIKLVYNGTPNENGGCTNTTGEITQVGTSQFGGAFNVGYGSPIREVIDTWYSENIMDYTKYLEDTVWCSDGSLYQENPDAWYWGGMERNVYSNKPSIVCPNDDDKFTVSSEAGNGKLTYPVALLTADEATLAGSGFKGYSSDSYLYTNQDWWLITPSYVSISISGI
ncbi:MAG: hypothetical protein HFG48_02845, partial [Bacilli bacterium]|nr:hypothetical protein [Bacilli bacterium]